MYKFCLDCWASLEAQALRSLQSWRRHAEAHLFKSRSIRKNFNQDQLSRSMSRSLLRLPSPSENAHVKVNVKVTVWSRQGRCQESTAAIISQECTCERRAHTKHYARTMAIISSMHTGNTASWQETTQDDAHRDDAVTQQSQQTMAQSAPPAPPLSGGSSGSLSGGSRPKPHARQRPGPRRLCFFFSFFLRQ